MMKRQATLTSLGFVNSTETPPPEKCPVIAGTWRNLTVVVTDHEPSVSADSQASALKFSDLNPPYDLGQVQNFDCPTKRGKLKFNSYFIIGS